MLGAILLRHASLDRSGRGGCTIVIFVLLLSVQLLLLLLLLWDLVKVSVIRTAIRSLIDCPGDHFEPADTDSRRTSLNIGLLGSTGTLVLTLIVCAAVAWVDLALFIALVADCAAALCTVLVACVAWLFCTCPIEAVVAAAIDATPAPAPTAIVVMAVARLARDPDVAAAAVGTSSPGRTTVVFFCFRLAHDGRWIR
uniref:Uncharacterized protein n=1 Tax=Anopheles culicifacies TaxID=139723 RepID=A0A182MTT9_9DIPT